MKFLNIQQLKYKFDAEKFMKIFLTYRFISYIIIRINFKNYKKRKNWNEFR